MQEPLWTKNFSLVCLANFLMFTGFYFLLPTLPVFVSEVLHGDTGNIGYIIGALSLTAVLVRPLSGHLLDTVGRKKVVLVALAGFTVAMGAYGLVTSFTTLFLLRIAHGLVWGFTTTGTGTIAADLVPRKRRGEGLGYYGLSNTLAMAVGPTLGLYILAEYGYSILFASGFVLAVCSAACMVFVTYQEQLGLKKAGTLTLQDLFEPRVFTLAVVMFFMAVVYGGVVSFITLYSKEIGVDNAGIYFTSYAITLLLVRPYAGKVFDRSGPLIIMALGFTALSLSFIVLYLAQGLWLLLLAALLMGIGFSIIHPIILAMAMNRVEPFRRGAANGTVFSAFDLGIGSGSILLGVLSKHIGLANMYLVCAIITLAPLAVFYLKDARENLIAK